MHSPILIKKYQFLSSKKKSAPNQIPIDAPDGRKLQLIVREGEQHDILQFTADFFQYYNVPFDSVQVLLL